MCPVMVQIIFPWTQTKLLFWTLHSIAEPEFRSVQLYTNIFLFSVCVLQIPTIDGHVPFYLRQTENSKRTLLLTRRLFTFGISPQRVSLSIQRQNRALRVVIPFFLRWRDIIKLLRKRDGQNENDQKFLNLEIKKMRQAQFCKDAEYTMGNRRGSALTQLTTSRSQPQLVGTCDTLSASKDSQSTDDT